MLKVSLYYIIRILSGKSGRSILRLSLNFIFQFEFRLSLFPGLYFHFWQFFHYRGRKTNQRITIAVVIIIDIVFQLTFEKIMDC